MDLYHFYKTWRHTKGLCISAILSAHLLLCVRHCSTPTEAATSGGISHWKLRDGDVVPAGQVNPAVALSPSMKTAAQESLSPALDPIFGILMGVEKMEKHLEDLLSDVSQPKHCHSSSSSGGAGGARASGSSPGVLDGCKSTPSASTQCGRQVAVSSSDDCGSTGGSGGSKAAGLLICSDLAIPATKYDFLEGIAKRRYHRNFPEPEVAMIFRKSDSDDAIDLWEVERRLKLMLKENRESSNVFNQIGNYWRIKGSTFQAIECFRKALVLKPDNSDVLLNLARVLFNHHYHDDAVFLTKESLHASDSPQETWLQHYTLGEIYKAMGSFQDSSHHLKKALDINPGFQAAEVHLRDLQTSSSFHANLYTVVIIFILILIVLVVIHKLIITNY